MDIAAVRAVENALADLGEHIKAAIEDGGLRDMLAAKVRTIGDLVDRVVDIEQHLGAEGEQPTAPTGTTEAPAPAASSTPPSAAGSTETAAAQSPTSQPTTVQ